jgi:hypothetical protein
LTCVGGLRHTVTCVGGCACMPSPTLAAAGPAGHPATHGRAAADGRAPSASLSRVCACACVRLTAGPQSHGRPVVSRPARPALSLTAGVRAANGGADERRRRGQAGGGPVPRRAGQIPPLPHELLVEQVKYPLSPTSSSSSRSNRPSPPRTPRRAGQTAPLPHELLVEQVKPPLCPTV